ncbi:MAG: spore coat protein [Firmicutes bacterium]|nr:spore coat protein [Bacillota bacterium]
MVKQLNDKLMLTDVLTHLKDIMTLSGMAFKESNCEKMRAMVTKTSERVGENQFALFQYMNQNGMYPIQNADPKLVKQSIKTFSE